MFFLRVLLTFKYTEHIHVSTLYIIAELKPTNACFYYVNFQLLSVRPFFLMKCEIVELLLVKPPSLNANLEAIQNQVMY